VLGNSLRLFGQRERVKPLPHCLATRSSGARGADHSPRSEGCVGVEAEKGTANAFARRHQLRYYSMPLVLSSEFFAPNGGHVLLDDIGLAFALARSFGAGDEWMYASHLRKHGALASPAQRANGSSARTAQRASPADPLLLGDASARVIARAAAKRALMVERQQELFDLLWPGGVPSSSAGFCARAVLAGTAVFNPRGGVGAPGAGRADASLWRDFSAWLLRRLRLPSTRAPPLPLPAATAPARRPRLLLTVKQQRLPRAILNADSLPDAPCMRGAFGGATAVRWETVSHMEAARLMQAHHVFLTPSGAAAFMALFMPRPSAVVYVAGEDRNDLIYLDALTHLLLRRYEPLASELIGRCAVHNASVEARFGGCAQRFRLRAERVCAQARATFEDMLDLHERTTGL